MNRNSRRTRRQFAFERALDTRNTKRAGNVHLKPITVVTAGVPFGRPYQAPFSVR